MWVEIDEEFFQVENLSIQYTITDSATITFEINLKTHEHYYNFFVNKHEEARTFIMHTNQFMSRGCLIKILKIDFKNKITVTITCDSIENDVSKLRDKTINKILDKDE